MTIDSNNPGASLQRDLWNTYSASEKIVGQFTEDEKQAFGRKGQALAYCVNRALWNHPLLPQYKRDLTVGEGFGIQEAALATVLQAWQHLSPQDREEFRGHTPVSISTSLDLFYKILGMASTRDGNTK